MEYLDTEHGPIFPGAKVLIRSDLEDGEIYDDVDFAPDMRQWAGTVVTITAVGEYGDRTFDIKEDDDDFLWSVGMIEAVMTVDESLSSSVEIRSDDLFEVISYG